MEIEVHNGRVPPVSSELLREFSDKEPHEVLLRTLYTGGERWSYVVGMEKEEPNLCISLALKKITKGQPGGLSSRGLAKGSAQPSST